MSWIKTFHKNTELPNNVEKSTSILHIFSPASEEYLIGHVNRTRLCSIFMLKKDQSGEPWVRSCQEGSFFDIKDQEIALKIGSTVCWENWSGNLMESNHNRNGKED